MPDRTTKSKSPENTLDAMNLLFRASRDFLDQMRFQNEPLWEMQDFLIQQLGNEKLEAFGIMINPDKGREPMKIASFIFRGHPKINWSNSTVENYGQQFEGVEVRKPRIQRNAFEGDTLHTNTRRGRPRVDGHLRVIVSAMQAEGSFAGKSKKERVALVRGRARTLYPDTFPKETQPSDAKIREALSAAAITKKQ